VFEIDSLIENLLVKWTCTD